MGHVPVIAPPREGDHIIRACFDAYAASGTEFSLEIEADCNTILHLVDLLLGDRVERKKLECIDRAGNNTVVASVHPSMFTCTAKAMVSHRIHIHKFSL